jgi:hypothetical protein
MVVLLRVNLFCSGEEYDELSDLTPAEFLDCVEARQRKT